MTVSIHLHPLISTPLVFVPSLSLLIFMSSLTWPLHLVLGFTNEYSFTIVISNVKFEVFTAVNIQVKVF